MKKLSILFFTLMALLVFDACKKDPKNPPDKNGGGGQYTTTDVKVVLPAGSNVDLATTKIFTFAQTASVGGDGNAKVPFVTNGCELAFLFDASDNLLLAGYIYDGNKELSAKSTALVLLYQGLGLNILPDSTRQIFLTKNANNIKLADYYTKIEQAFKADAQMLEKRSFMTSLDEAVKMIADVKPVDIYGKQIDIVDDDVRSQIQIEKIDDDNVNIKNSSYRRAHAFVYKTAYKDQNNHETILLYNIDFDDKADKDTKVEKVQFVKNAIDMYAQYYSSNPAITGPVEIPLASNEKEATYKIRVIGPGKPVVTLTDAEKVKLDELYEEYLAYNILAPFIAEVTGVRSHYTINEDNLSAYLQKVKTIAQLDPGIMQTLKDGKDYNGIPGKFFKAMDNAGQSKINLINSFLDGFRTQFSDRQLPSEQQITDAEKLVNKGLGLLEYLTGTTSPKFVLAAHDYFNTMEEFTVKAKDYDVKISPKKSDVMAFINHPLTVEANPALNSGETIEYEWTTAGTFGVLKNGTQEGTTFTTTAKTINYYGKTTPDENNIEKVVVTAYVKSSGGARTQYGSDTATINVKKVKLEMRPDDATLSPSKGITSVKLYIVNADGTDPIVNSAAIQYRIEWSTPGTYGYFAGGITQSNTSVNNITYVATDDEVEDATENITARVYFKLANTGWMLREEIKGKVKIDNELKKKIIHVPIGYMHGDSTTMNGTRGLCYWAFIASVPEEPNAVKYEARVLSTTYYAASFFPTYSWNATGPYPNTHAHYVVPPYTNGTFNISFSNSGATTELGKHLEFTDPNTPGMTGIAEVTIYLK